MTISKYWRLVTLLIRKTKDGTADWQPTSRDGTFALSLPDYSVRISLVKGEGHDGQDVQFQIVDSNGKVIDSFRDIEAARDHPDRNGAYKAAEELFNDARRQALGVDKALDKLIEELDKA